jgi:hypothetical protein
MLVWTFDRGPGRLCAAHSQVRPIGGPCGDFNRFVYLIIFPFTEEAAAMPIRLSATCVDPTPWPSMECD